LSKLKKNLQLDIDAYTVYQAILNAPKLKFKEKHVAVINSRKLHILPLDTTREKRYFSLQHLKSVLPKIIVKGIPTVQRCVIYEEKDKITKIPKYRLLVEGYDLLSVLATSGVDQKRTTSNHIIEVEKTLGIEAARLTVMNEIQYTMQQHGMSIDQRHVQLLADLMSFKGEILGITRFGVSKMKESVLMLASFEMTTDHLFEAAVHNRQDHIVGVSECIIMGIPIPLGTGMFKLIQKATHDPLPEKKRLLLDAYQHKKIDIVGL